MSYYVLSVTTKKCEKYKIKEKCYTYTKEKLIMPMELFMH